MKVIHRFTEDERKMMIWVKKLRVKSSPDLLWGRSWLRRRKKWKRRGGGVSKSWWCIILITVLIHEMMMIRTRWWQGSFFWNVQHPSDEKRWWWLHADDVVYLNQTFSWFWIRTMLQMMIKRREMKEPHPDRRTLGLNRLKSLSQSSILKKRQAPASSPDPTSKSRKNQQLVSRSFPDRTDWLDHHYSSIHLSFLHFLFHRSSFCDWTPLIYLPLFLWIIPSSFDRNLISCPPHTPL